MVYCNGGEAKQIHDGLVEGGGGGALAPPPQPRYIGQIVSLATSKRRKTVYQLTCQVVFRRSLKGAIVAVMVVNWLERSAGRRFF